MSTTFILQSSTPDNDQLIASGACLADILKVANKILSERAQRGLEKVDFRVSRCDIGTEGDVVFSPIPHSVQYAANLIINNEVARAA